jgi:hypothetical protein
VTTIIIHARVLPNFEHYSSWEPRDEPVCYWCDGPMEYVRDDPSGLFDDDEIWKCMYCHSENSYLPNDYGEDEIVMTKEEWEAEQGLMRQRWYLAMRYGSEHPRNIHNY